MPCEQMVTLCHACTQCQVSNIMFSTVTELISLFSGTFAVVSLMTGSVVEQLVPSPLEMNSSSPEAAEFEGQRIVVASAVALLSGIIMVKQTYKIYGLKSQNDYNYATEIADLSFC